MATERKTRVLWCKKATVSPASGTLQDMLIDALSRKRRARDRSESTSSDPANGAFRLIAQHHHIASGIAGIFTAYEKGSSAVSIDNDPDATQISITQLRPPSADLEWSEGLLYFYIQGDFVVLIQAMGVRQEQFEDHLFWLLKKRGERIGPTVKFIDQATKSARDMVKKSHIKSINVGGPLAARDGANSGTSSQHQEVKLMGPMLDGLKSMFDGDGGFRWNDALDGNIEATLHITYKRQTNKLAQLLLDDIGLALHKLKGVDTELVLNNGEKIKGNLLRLTKKSTIPASDGVLHTDEAFTAMVTWLGELANSGHLR